MHSIDITDYRRLLNYGTRDRYLLLLLDGYVHTSIQDSEFKKKYI